MSTAHALSPVGGTFDAAALQPPFLDPVYEILLVGVVPVVHDERLKQQKFAQCKVASRLTKGHKNIA